MFQKSEGFRDHRTPLFIEKDVKSRFAVGVKGDVVVGYRESLTTPDLKSSGIPDVLGRS